MSIRDLMDKFEIQGAYHIKGWIDAYDDYIILAKGTDFECDRNKIKSKYLDAEITYMYAIDGELNIEVKL